MNSYYLLSTATEHPRKLTWSFRIFLACFSLLFSSFLSLPWWCCVLCHQHRVLSFFRLPLIRTNLEANSNNTTFSLIKTTTTNKPTQISFVVKSHVCMLTLYTYSSFFLHISKGKHKQCIYYTINKTAAMFLEQINTFTGNLELLSC